MQYLLTEEEYKELRSKKLSDEQRDEIIAYFRGFEAYIQKAITAAWKHDSFRFDHPHDWFIEFKKQNPPPQRPEIVIMK